MTWHLFHGFLLHASTTQMQASNPYEIKLNFTETFFYPLLNLRNKDVAKAQQKRINFQAKSYQQLKHCLQCRKTNQSKPLHLMLYHKLPFRTLSAWHAKFETSQNSGESDSLAHFGQNCSRIKNEKVLCANYYTYIAPS